MVIFIVSLFPPLYPGYQRFFSAPGWFGVGRRPNWPETALEKSLAPRVPPLRDILAKAPSTLIRTFLNPRLFESALQRGNFWRTLNPDAFSSGDVTISSPVLYREYCIQDGNLVVRFSQGRALFFTTHALLPIFPAESWVPEWSRIRVRYVWTWKLLNPERKKLWIQKHPDACGGGLKLVEEWQRLSRFPTRRTATAWYWEILVLVMSWVC